MRRRRSHLTSSLIVTSALLALTAWQAHHGQAQEAPAAAELVVHADRPGPRVSPLMYGVFFEEINHAGDGGIYAELVRNRSFEDGTAPEAWSAVAREGGQPVLALDTDRPLNAAQGKSLRVELRGPGAAGVANDGYWGVPVRKGAEYRLSLFARASSRLRTPLVASLEGKDGRVYARRELGGLKEEWTRLTGTLRASESDPAARLVLTTPGTGTLWLDVVSLFPADTWKGRANGLRRDLAEKVAGLAPAFVRFPGGCFVEGSRLENAVRWKRTIGPIEERPGHPNAKWGYRSSDGLGYHEYLQWCEDLGAEPIFIINCGMACGFDGGECVPLEELGEWIQDALDAIEYANGPVTSRWGAVRAKNGHPKPFNMKLLGVGNENGWGQYLPQYEERYARFYDAIKKRYPEMQLIATTPVRSRPMDILDDHYYNNPQWFWANTGLYDRRDRKGPKIYVGEFAVTQNAGTGNLAAAVAEAAFMTGLERNADLVQMASYAPLFVNVRDRKWNPDAIPFDTSRSYGTPSYYVQKLFAENRPDVVLNSELSLPPATVEKGGIGLGTWLTQAEFKDVEVIRDGKTVYSSRFQDDAPEWRRQGGEWSVRNGALRQSAAGEDRRIVLAEPSLADASDYTLRLKARKLGGAEGFLIMFRNRSRGDFYWWNIGGWQNREHAIEKGVGGGKVTLGPRVPGSVETGRWYDIRIELQGPRVRCYLDGKLIHDEIDRGTPDLAAVAGRVDRTGEIILKVANGAETARPMTLRLNGAGLLRGTGTATVLTSGSMADENSLDQPERVAPRTVPVEGVSSRFTYTFPPRSVTVLRLKKR
ncbi:MAG: alpha-L-arabinofuranosidase C-terminal domain-containing protein [Armatimonadota bacterium]